MPSAEPRTGPVLTCAYCGSSELKPVLSLGSHPPSNAFIAEADIPRERRYPLDVLSCASCFLVQLGYIVRPREIFDHYLYLSSSSEALKRHYHALARELTERFSLQSGDLVVDIGCNDGILLHGFEPRLRRVGVEPSDVAEIARDSGLEVLRAYFDEAVAAGIVDRFGTAAVVTATNVFAHVTAVDSFVRGVRRLLGERAVFVIEASYLPDLIDQRLFDTVYHEHLYYLALTPLMPYLERHGLRVIDVERVPFGASGPAFRVYASSSAFPLRATSAPDELLQWERRWGIGKDGTYARFAERVGQIRDEVLAILHDARRRGARIGGYGAPAKGNTLLNYLGLDDSVIQLIAETNRLKQGLVTPGTHIPIVSEERFLEEMPEYALLLAWNYVDYFMKHSAYVRRGGRFIVPLPEPRVVTA